MNHAEKIKQSRILGLTAIAPEIDFTDQNVLITGAGSGIGRATAHMLHQFGAHIIALDIQDKALEDLKASLRGERISTLCFDLSQTDPQAYSDLASAIVGACPTGQLDSFIASAGVVRLQKQNGLQGTPAKEFNALNQINAMANADLFRALFNNLADDIRIVLVSSPIVGRADVNTPGYAISKGLMEAVGNQMKADLENTPARITGFVPPPVQNYLRAELKPQEPLHAHPHGEDIAELPARLACKSLKPEFHGQVITMAYSHLRKSGTKPSGERYDYMPRSQSSGFYYDLKTRKLSSGGGEEGELLQKWDTISSRQIQNLSDTPPMDENISLQEVYKTPDHILAHRQPE